MLRLRARCREWCGRTTMPAMASLSAKPLTIAVTILFIFGYSPARGQQSSTLDFSSHLGLLSFTLEKSTLADVTEKLGSSTPGGCSKDVEARNVVCYVSSGLDKTRIFFESGFAGDWSTLDGFKVVAGNETPTCRLRCKAIAKFGSDVQTSGGLKLGLTRDQLIGLLGSPIGTHGGKLTFQRSSKRPMTEAEIAKEKGTFKGPVTSPYWDVQDTIVVMLRDSKVVEFEVNHAVTD